MGEDPHLKSTKKKRVFILLANVLSVVGRKKGWSIFLSVALQYGDNGFFGLFGKRGKCRYFLRCQLFYLEIEARCYPFLLHMGGLYSKCRYFFN